MVKNLPDLYTVFGGIQVSMATKDSLSPGENVTEMIQPWGMAGFLLLLIFMEHTHMQAAAVCQVLLRII